MRRAARGLDAKCGNATRDSENGYDHAPPVRASRLLPAINERNPYLRDQVGGCIFEFIKLMVPAERVPKITGMLIELPVDMIKQYMSSFEALQAKVTEANELIEKSEQE